MHGNLSNCIKVCPILVIMFELLCNDLDNFVEQGGRVPDGIQAVHKVLLTEES